MGFQQHIKEAIMGALLGAIGGGIIGAILLVAWGALLNLNGTYDAETYPSSYLIMGFWVASAGAFVRIATIKGAKDGDIDGIDRQPPKRP